MPNAPGQEDEPQVDNTMLHFKNAYCKRVEGKNSRVMELESVPNIKFWKRTFRSNSWEI